jgi:endonuclease III
MANAGDRKKKTAFIRWLDKSLLKEYGDKPVPETRPDPLDELVLTVLSQNTNDVNRDRAYEKLRKKYPSWEKVAKAPAEKIEDEIRVGGLAGQKSRRIKKMLLEIKKREGDFDLSRICEMPRQEALSYLYSFKGVGEKTAAIVLLFCCGVPVFPVDTHIHRLSKRFGLVPVDANAKKAHEIMGDLVPDKIMHRFHINVIEHGRAVCRARKPDCPDCCLIKKCPSANMDKNGK